MAIPYFFRQASRLFLFPALLCALLLPGRNAQATHITGGMLTYTHTGSNTYVISMLLHFDEVNGMPAAVDQSVPVALYNAGTGQYLNNITLNRVGALPGPCEPQCGYCVSSHGYTIADVMLTVPAEGLKLVFERCCRSNMVQNIPEPHERGIYISTVIPNVPNSSAIISSPLPPLLFLNTANNFSAAATDADGDELHYRLDNLYYGNTSPADPIALPASYNSPTGPWANGFSTQNMLGGPQPLQIDFNTGHISATPGTNGYFQIAYFVEEHRNNQLIGITRNEATVFVTEPSAACLLPVEENTPDWAKWSVLPNPFTDRIRVQLPENFRANATAALLSSMGRIVVPDQRLVVENGFAVLNLAHAALPAGFYLLRVSTLGQHHTFRLLHPAK